MDFTHGHGDPLLTSTAFVYTLKASSVFFLSFPDGGPISIGAMMQTLTALSTVEAELVVAISFGAKRKRMPISLEVVMAV